VSEKGTRLPVRDHCLSHAEKRGNVHDNQTVVITASSCSYGGLESIRDLKTKSTFEAAPGRREVSWAFGSKRVCLGPYTIQSSKLKSCVFEGRNDGKTWQEIDRRDNWNPSSRLFAGPPTAYFDVSAFDHQSAELTRLRYLRLRQPLSQHSPEARFALDAVEFFGTLLDYPQKRMQGL
jgi:hypothetical protein